MSSLGLFWKLLIYSVKCVFNYHACFCFDGFILLTCRSVLFTQTWVLYGYCVPDGLFPFCVLSFCPLIVSFDGYIHFWFSSICQSPFGAEEWLVFCASCWKKCFSISKPWRFGDFLLFDCKGCIVLCSHLNILIWNWFFYMVWSKYHDFFYVNV